MSDSKNIWDMSFGASLWSSDLMEKARATKFLIYVLLLILSGVGNIFVVNSPSIQFFNKSLTASTEYIQTFYNSDMRKYIEDLGFFDQAQKSGIVPSAERIKQFIETQAEFIKDDKFDLQKYKNFLQNKSLKEHELVEHYKRKLTVEVFKEAIFFNEMPEKYPINDKKLKFSILLTNNSIYQDLQVDSKEFREFLIRQLKENSMCLTDSEKLAVQYIEIQNIDNTDEKSIIKFYEVLKNSRNLIEDCKKFFGSQSKVSTFLLPLGTKGKYHKLNFIFDKVYFRSDKNTTIFAIVKKIEARSLKDSSKIDFDFLKKLYLGQITYKIRLLRMLMQPLSSREDVYAIKHITLDSIKHLNILRQKGLLFMKPGSSQVFKSSDVELNVAILDSIEDTGSSKEYFEICNQFLSNTLSHNSFINTAIAYWTRKFTSEM